MPAAGSQAGEVPALSVQQQKRFDFAMSRVKSPAVKKVFLETLQAVHKSGFDIGYDKGWKDGVEDADPIVE